MKTEGAADPKGKLSLRHRRAEDSITLRRNRNEISEDCWKTGFTIGGFLCGHFDECERFGILDSPRRFVEVNFWRRLID
jgi:hypothetical protein